MASSPRRATRLSTPSANSTPVVSRKPEALLPSSTDEVRRLLVRARDLTQMLGKPVRLSLSDKQDAFGKAIGSEFPGVPHRYCSNHFLRELAKPTLELDTYAKVPMRKKVRNLRGIERQVLLTQRGNAQAVTPQEECWRWTSLGRPTDNWVSWPGSSTRR